MQIYPVANAHHHMMNFMYFICNNKHIVDDSDLSDYERVTAIYTITYV